MSHFRPFSPTSILLALGALLASPLLVGCTTPVDETVGQSAAPVAPARPAKVTDEQIRNDIQDAAVGVHIAPARTSAQFQMVWAPLTNGSIISAQLIANTFGPLLPDARDAAQRPLTEMDVETMGGAAFFRSLSPSPDRQPTDREEIAHYASLEELYRVLGTHLSNMTVYRFGRSGTFGLSGNITTFVMGTTPNGNMAGVLTYEYRGGGLWGWGFFF